MARNVKQAYDQCGIQLVTLEDMSSRGNHWKRVFQGDRTVGAKMAATKAHVGDVKQNNLDCRFKSFDKE